MARRQNFQTVAWFNDIFRRKLLELEPPYQRRSVWNRDYKDYFIDTLLLQYPAPAIFLYEEVDRNGRATYNVVDGKQRLTTIFEFLDNRFPVSERAEITALRGMYFQQFDDDTRKNFYSYQFSVEYLPSDNENVINNIFDRINRNVAKLSAQELRHAKLDGEFITSCEQLAGWMLNELPPGFPYILPKSKLQMKDVEITANLLLLLEEGVRGYSQADLDREFSDRDEDWERRNEIEEKFRLTIRKMRTLVNGPDGPELARSRYRNQADFYSLFAALSQIPEANINQRRDVARLMRFINTVESEEERAIREPARIYYDAARSASNDPGPRSTRIYIIEDLLAGKIPWAA